MPVEYDGVVYLNEKESRAYLGGIGYAAFQHVREEYHLQSYKGLAGNAVYFRQDELDKIPRMKKIEASGA